MTSVDEDLTHLDEETIISLARKNFSRFAPDGLDKFTRQQLVDASHQQFSTDEQELIRVLLRYFRVIADLASFDEGLEPTISNDDIMVLEQFLVHSRMTLKDLNGYSAQITR